MLKFTLGLFFTTFFILLPLLLHSRPYCFYFFKTYWTRERLTQVVTTENNVRLEHAKNEFKNRKSGHVIHESAETQLDFVIGVISVKREHKEFSTGYLTQVMAKLINEVNNKTQVFICDTYAGPGVHDEAIQLLTHFKTYTRFPNGSMEHTKISGFIKEKQDKLYCLTKADNYNARWVIMLEDDGVPRRHFLYQSTTLLRRIQERMQKGGDADQFGFLKLYYPERWQGFSSDYQSAVELTGWGIISSSVFLYINHFIRRRPCRRIVLVCCIGFVYGMLLASAVGRQFLLEFRRFSTDLLLIRDAPMCCTQAHLYSRTSAVVFAKGLINEIMKNPSSLTPFDLVIDKIAEEERLKGFLVEPNIVQHIGFVSSLKGISKHPEQFVYNT